MKDLLNPFFYCLNTTTVVTIEAKKKDLMEKRKFGELELCIRKILQKRNRATVHDIVLEIQDSSYTTVMTVMSRMALKNELLREKCGKQYVYWINPNICPSSILSRLQEKLFGGKKASLVSYLLENDEELSSDELVKLEKLILDHKKRKQNG